MPILAKEVDVFPSDLLDRFTGQQEESLSHWYALYTLSRREKQLMRKLTSLSIPFYGPIIERRYRSPNGRVRTSYAPLFSNYVFIYGDESKRHKSLTTNCVARCYEVQDGRQLVKDLQSIRRLIEIGRPLTPETSLVCGDRVRVKSGLFAGFEGTILRRDKETRLLVAVNFTRQGASVLLDDCQLDLIQSD
jgi:transcription antitermination factor NusG